MLRFARRKEKGILIGFIMYFLINVTGNDCSISFRHKAKLGFITPDTCDLIMLRIRTGIFFDKSGNPKNSISLFFCYELPAILR